MFQEFVTKLSRVERFDRVANTKDIQVGEVEGEGGAPRLALRLPTSEIVTLEDRAHAQLAGQWGIPAAHLERLPTELAAEELTHFFRSAPRDVTIRTVWNPGQDLLSARGVLSGKYQPFDSHEVLQAIEPHLAGFEVSSAVVERDEMRMLVTMPEQRHDVSTRRVGDITKAGLMISNSEVGTMALRVEFSLLRLVCTNGMTSTDFESARVRHIHVDRAGFVDRLRQCVVRAGRVGEQIARRLEATHALELPDLNPDNGRIQREVISVLRRENLWTQGFALEAEAALFESGERSLFSLIQFISDNSSLTFARLTDRVHRERVAGRLIALAA